MKEADIRVGHVLDVLATLPAESVSCVVTSPPYWSLRKYDASDVVWGGDPDCSHTWEKEQTYDDSPIRSGAEGIGFDDSATTKAQRWRESATCSRCGAWRGQFGLEPTPELYVEHTVAILRAIRRVLRPDGVVFWNIGDGYASNPAKGGSGPGGKEMAYGIHEDYNAARRSRSGLRGRGKAELRPHQTDEANADEGQREAEAHALRPLLKAKDLILMPERVALALQADGWWVRSRIAWTKPNAMPESTRDRPTSAWETIWMLTKSARYWWDQEAVREPSRGQNHHDLTGPGYSAPGQTRQSGNRREFRGSETYTEGYAFDADTPRPNRTPGNDGTSTGRNLRNVWEFPTAQTPEAHFATFPEELPRRCILAACPPEICAKCGTARVREVESTTRYEGGSGKAGNNPTGGKWGDDRPGDKILMGPVVDTRTTGWSSCDCAEPDYQPGLVLDPFAGIGTTGIVAKRLGRRFIGIELSEAYAAMAREKLAHWWRKLDLSESEAPDGQQTLEIP